MLVDDEHVASIDAVADLARCAGLCVSAVLGAAGVITGTTDGPDAISAIEALDGVRCVEVAREIRLPPPDSRTQ